jgi:exodeoxyribonuclease VII large subunit
MKMIENVISISELTKEISELLQNNLSRVQIVGEVSNLKYHSSGHIYFTLKDESASISAVIWRSRAPKFPIKEGMKLKAGGSVSVFAAKGSYQFDCIWVQEYGLGDLFVAYEELKAKLELKGYFSQERKRQIPHFVEKVGVATSSTGSVIQDIISTLANRAPQIEIVLRPTVVQGNEASKDIVKAITELNKQNVDVIIIGRGGGSFEDLFPFSSEEVADAIYNSEKPIISAVGHETDFSIADFVADKRAATPTQAATFVSMNSIEQILGYLEEKERNYTKRLQNEINANRDKLEFILVEKIENRVSSIVSNYNNKLSLIEQKLDNSINLLVRSNIEKLNLFEMKLSQANPNLQLERGYAIIKKDNHAISSSTKLKKGETLQVIRLNQENEVLVQN